MIFSCFIERIRSYSENALEYVLTALSKILAGKHDPLNGCTQLNAAHIWTLLNVFCLHKSRLTTALSLALWTWGTVHLHDNINGNCLCLVTRECISLVLVLLSTSYFSIGNHCLILARLYLFFPAKVLSIKFNAYRLNFSAFFPIHNFF